MNKKIIAVSILLPVLFFSYSLYNQAVSQPSYNGLPSVPCIDSTLPVKNSFSFKLKITIKGRNFPLDKTIGHDPGQCLRSIYTIDSSGRVFVKSNSDQTYSLKDFFHVWHKAFDKTQLFGNRIESPGQIQIKVNDRSVDTLEKTPLFSRENIQINYH